MAIQNEHCAVVPEESALHLNLRGVSDFSTDKIALLFSQLLPRR